MQTVIMRNLLLVALFLIVTVVLSAAQDYCNLNSCSSREHIMCFFPNSNAGPTCGQQIKKVGLTQYERRLIVTVHNNVRTFVAGGHETRGSNGPQPRATNMKKLRWDNELETIAQRWANQCIFDLDFCKDVPRFAVGQNSGSTQKPGVENATPNFFIQAWYDEVRNFDKDEIASYRGESDTQHYTQVVWAETTTIGCGSIRYKDENNKDTYYLVCNYGTAGNILGQSVYKTPNEE